MSLSSIAISPLFSLGFFAKRNNNKVCCLRLLKNDGSGSVPCEKEFGSKTGNGSLISHLKSKYPNHHQVYLDALMKIKSNKDFVSNDEGPAPVQQKLVWKEHSQQPQFDELYELSDTKSENQNPINENDFSDNESLFSNKGKA